MASLKKTMELAIVREVDYGFGVLEEMAIRIAQVSNDTLNGIATAGKEWHRARSEAVAAMVSRWDLRGPVPIEDTGELKEGSVIAADELIPIDADVIQHLPVPVVQGLVEGIWAAATPKRESRNGTSTETLSE